MEPVLGPRKSADPGADDCNIYVRSRRARERVMASVSRFLTKKLRLKVNETKSAVARPEERKFLGFSISNDGSERRIAPKALDKFKTQVRDMTRRTRGISLPRLVEELTPYLIGWRGYFGFCQTPRVLTTFRSWRTLAPMPRSPRSLVSHFTTARSDHSFLVSNTGRSGEWFAKPFSPLTEPGKVRAVERIVEGSSSGNGPGAPGR